MSLTTRQSVRSRSVVRLGRIASRSVRVGVAFAFVGASICLADAQISQPGMPAWVLVMSAFGAVFGLMGGRAIDVLAAAASGSLIFGLAAYSSQTTVADGVAIGLLMGAIAGGLFRPWFTLATGLFSLLRTAIAARAPQARSDIGG